MSRKRGSRGSLLAAAALLGLAVVHYSALWDHASRLPHPTESSLATFFPDVTPLAEWLRRQPVDAIAVPSRHLDPLIYHRFCEMVYPIRCRPFPEITPEPGRWVVLEPEPRFATIPSSKEDPRREVRADSVLIRREGRLEVRQVRPRRREP